MNDQHPHAGYVGDDAHTTGSYSTGSYTTGAYDTGSYETGSFATDPLFGALPGTETRNGGYQAGYETDYAQHSGQYDSTQWTGETTGYVEYSEYTGQWDANAWNDNGQAQYDTGAYDATAWHYAPTETFVPEQYDYAATAHAPGAESLTDEPGPFVTPESQEPAESLEPVIEPEPAAEPESGPEPELASQHEAMTVTAPVVAVPRPARRAGSGGSRGRRRTPAKRSALLTVAVPSACVMGVAGIAAASVSGLTEGEAKPEAKPVTAADTASLQTVAANSALDTQLAALSADARDFGDRASRTQERIDLKARQEAERKKREEEAARREAMRPKFALPVQLHQLSAQYGQAGVNWMSLHTGIDFPVQYGTPVMAATDGTVRTQWNSAYGNMAIVTAKDGTETWYCHLSSTKIRSGEVKAGEVIAYSGNSGNSTGPHLHFEVRPGGGSAIDPLPWLRSHGLDPTS
ncbi:peptidoglycan DD-metalloendopeptidase family protein [Streptomyces sp. NPDC051310]|uniref:peptidoglycan DD-metalloendopeptidase family protein n=1 Tax=Streptomyces sp. NPDC051310 TaxID=3365649 RepID=UPI0037AAB8E5